MQQDSKVLNLIPKLAEMLIATQFKSYVYALITWPKCIPVLKAGPGLHGHLCYLSQELTILRQNEDILS